MERDQLKKVLDAADANVEQIRAGMMHDDAQTFALTSIACSLVAIAHLLDQIVGRDGLNVGTVRTESGY